MVTLLGAYVVRLEWKRHRRVSIMVVVMVGPTVLRRDRKRNPMVGIMFVILVGIRRERKSKIKRSHGVRVVAGVLGARVGVQFSE